MAFLIDISDHIALVEFDILGTDPQNLQTQFRGPINAALREAAPPPPPSGTFAGVHGLFKQSRKSVSAA